LSDPTPAVRARVYLRDSDEFEGSPARALVYSSFVDAGVRDVAIHHGVMGFDRSSGLLSLRPLRFHADLPSVVEAVGRREEIEAALPGIRRVLSLGLITVTDVDLYEPGS
jgi:PII-like signaling protein